MQNLLLAASIALASVYGGLLCDRAPSAARTVVKSLSVALLAVWASVAGGPLALVLALTLSALGDAFLAGNPSRWLLPGMAAFLAAHLFYLGLFLSLEPRPTAVVTWALQTGLLSFAVAWSVYLWRDAGTLRWPVVAYAITIGFMGAAAIRLSFDRWMVVLGAAMFIASDIVLSVELFKLPEDSAVKVLTSRILWGLYFVGQCLLAYGIR